MTYHVRSFSVSASLLLQLVPLAMLAQKHLLPLMSHMQVAPSSQTCQGHMVVITPSDDKLAIHSCILAWRWSYYTHTSTYRTVTFLGVFPAFNKYIFSLSSGSEKQNQFHLLPKRVHLYMYVCMKAGWLAMNYLKHTLRRTHLICIWQSKNVLLKTYSMSNASEYEYILVYELAEKVHFWRGVFAIN